MQKRANDLNNYMVDKNSNKPRAKRTKKKSTVDNLEPTQTTDAVPSIDVQRLMQEALKSFAEARVRSTADELNAVSSILEEFLQSYVLIAYTMKGDPINIMFAPTQQDADALSTSVTRFFMQHNDRGI